MFSKKCSGSTSPPTLLTIRILNHPLNGHDDVDNDDDDGVLMMWIMIMVMVMMIGVGIMITKMTIIMMYAE